MSKELATADLPVVSVVGRPNVGKSTLFNRLTGSRRAIVDAVPGVTRDRLEHPVEWRGRWVRLVDTGGIDLTETETIPRQVLRQARQAVTESQVVVLLVDARAGLSPVERDIADLLRRSAVPVIVAANKVDARSLEPRAAEFHALGLGEVVPVSAEQGLGVDDLLDAILEELPDAPRTPPPDVGLHVAVVGRPNVGKSSLVNRLLGEERVVVSEEPGTTRDAVDVRLEVAGEPYVLVDTAGLRRRRTDRERVDHVARVMAQRALERADVALVMLDAGEGVTHQDAVITGLAVEAGAAVVLLLNKWDLVPDQERAHPELMREVEAHLPFASWAPVLTLSVKTGERVHRIFAEVRRVRDNRLRRVRTAELNAVVEEATARHPPPAGRRGRQVALKYVTQVGVAPPTFVAFSTGGRPPATWQRYLENRLREAFDFSGTPIVVHHRAGGRRGRR